MAKSIANSISITTNSGRDVIGRMAGFKGMDSIVFSCFDKSGNYLGFISSYRGEFGPICNEYETARLRAEIAVRGRLRAKCK